MFLERLNLLNLRMRFRKLIYQNIHSYCLNILAWNRTTGYSCVVGGYVLLHCREKGLSPFAITSCADIRVFLHFECSNWLALKTRILLKTLDQAADKFTNPLRIRISKRAMGNQVFYDQETSDRRLPFFISRYIISLYIFYYFEFDIF